MALPRFGRLVMSCLLCSLSKTLLRDTSAKRLSELDSAEKLRVEQDLEVGAVAWTYVRMYVMHVLVYSQGWVAEMGGGGPVLGKSALGVVDVPPVRAAGVKIAPNQVLSMWLLDCPGCVSSLPNHLCRRRPQGRVLALWIMQVNQAGSSLATLALGTSDQLHHLLSHHLPHHTHSSLSSLTTSPTILIRPSSLSPPPPYSFVPLLSHHLPHHTHSSLSSLTTSPFPLVLGMMWRRLYRRLT